MRCSRKLHSVAESKIHTYDNEGASTISDTDVLYDNDHLSVGCHRRKERLHGYGFYDREDISYYRETKLCSNFRDERFADNHIQTAYTKNYRRKGHRSSRDEIYPYPTRNQDEREYIFEQKITRVENEILERDWYHRERGVTVEDMDPLTYRESRRSKYSSYTDKEEETQWRRRRRSDKHYFRKRSDNGEGHPLLECEHGDDFMGEKYRRSIPSIGREKDSLEEKYEKRLQCADRKMENSGRRERYSERPILDMDYSWSTGIQDDHQRHMDHQFLSSRSHGEPHSGGGRCHDTMSPRDDVYDLRSSERYGRRRTQIYSERWRDRDTFGSYNDANYTENSIVYPDGGVHFGRRRHSWQSREMHWTEDELISKHPDDELYNEEESFSHEKISRHERMRAKHGSAHGRMLIDDEQSKRHRHRMIREGSSGNVINRRSDSIHRCTHEQTVPRCRDSVDMVVGDGKSSGRCTKAASIMCNGRLESLNSKIDEERMTSEDFNQSYRGMAVQPGIPKIGSNQNNEKWHHKFLITEHNEALDLEEGQIVPDEPDKGVPIEKKHVSESEALTGDVKKMKLQNKNAANGNTVSGGYDNHRILETLAKMEKRGERFKEPLTLKKEPDKNPNSQVDPIVETTETKQQRPVRKRRWVGS
ncbi:hypothetical protein L1049_016554 [Liquidambar formosana]|uniref:FIP1[III]-like protein n=1 Tax=Liquidambar formosana TaxID=63359 RepID=A0AAP0S6B0_LIQFO